MVSLAEPSSTFTASWTFGCQEMEKAGARSARARPWALRPRRRRPIARPSPRPLAANCYLLLLGRHGLRPSTTLWLDHFRLVRVHRPATDLNRTYRPYPYTRQSPTEPYMTNLYNQHDALQNPYRTKGHLDRYWTYFKSLNPSSHPRGAGATTACQPAAALYVHHRGPTVAHRRHRHHHPGARPGGQSSSPSIR